MPDYTNKETLLALSKIDPELDAVRLSGPCFGQLLTAQVSQTKPAAASRLLGH